MPTTSPIRRRPGPVPLAAVAAVVGAAVAMVLVIGGARGPAWPTRGHGTATDAVEGASVDVVEGAAADAGLGARPAAGPGAAPATGLDPGLAAALDRARRAAAADDVAVSVTSGFRTGAEQAALLADAVVEHGSRAAAQRWVFPPDRSMHVRGLAVDVGAPAARWLDRHGARFGLCRTLEWEWWHFEWRARWEAAGACPGPVDDPMEAPPE